MNMWSRSNNDEIGGILLKTRPEYARTFIENWRRTGKPQVFLIYDRRPILRRGDSVFVYVVRSKHLSSRASICDRGYLGFYANFVRSEWVRGLKRLEDEGTRKRERERIWALYGDGQLHTRSKEEFDRFWDDQDGVRSLVVLENLVEIEKKITWSDLKRILYTNRFPRGVGYIYITKSEVNEILKLIHM